MANDETKIIPTGGSEEWTGPKHAMSRPGWKDRVRTTPRDTLKEFATPRGEAPYERGQVAQSGDYEKALVNANFRLSHLLSDAGPYIERGDFEGGLEATETGIGNRHIVI